MAMDFSKSKSNNLVNSVLKQVDETSLDNKKRDIEISLIDLNEDNEDIFGYDDVDFLATEIAEFGFSGAIEVYAKKDGRYEVSSGHRRLLAAKKNGYQKVPCIISEDVDDATKAQKLIMSNIHHRKMSPLMWAKAINYYEKNVLDKNKQYEGRKRDELARKFNISPASVHRYTVLLNLIPELQKQANTYGYPYNILVPIASLSKEDQLKVLKMLEDIAEDRNIANLSVKIVNGMVQRYKDMQEEEKNKKNINEQFIKNTEEDKSESENVLNTPSLNSNVNDSDEFASSTVEEGIKAFDDSFSSAYNNQYTITEETAEAEEEGKINSEIDYCINRIMSLKKNIKESAQKEKWINQLKSLIEEME